MCIYKYHRCSSSVFCNFGLFLASDPNHSSTMLERSTPVARRPAACKERTGRAEDQQTHQTCTLKSPKAPPFFGCWYRNQFALSIKTHVYILCYMNIAWFKSFLYAKRGPLYSRFFIVLSGSRNVVVGMASFGVTVQSMVDMINAKLILAACALDRFLPRFHKENRKRVHPPTIFGMGPLTRDVFFHLSTSSLPLNLCRHSQ